MRPTSFLFHRELEDKLELLQDWDLDDDSRWPQDEYCYTPEPRVALAYADGMYASLALCLVGKLICFL